MMKLVTWNVNSIAVRLERLLALLARESPDVVCLQELKTVDEKFPFLALQDAGYQAAVYGQKTYNGVAVLSKIKPDVVVRGFGDSVDDLEARFVSARFGDTTIISAYFPNGQAVGSEKFRYKLLWMQRLRQYLGQHHKPDDRLLLAGDFNVAPSDIDVYDPKAWREQVLCSTAERQALADISSFGLVDSFRHLHPDLVQYTWWDYRMLAFPKNLGLRIDHIYATSALVERLVECRVDRNERKGEKPSDHAPLVAVFDV